MATDLEIRIHEFKSSLDTINKKVVDHDETLKDLEASIDKMTLNLVKIQYLIAGAIGFYMSQQLGFIELLKATLLK